MTRTQPTDGGLAQRCAALEDDVRRLREELAAAHDRIAALEAAADAGTADSLSLFQGSAADTAAGAESIDAGPGGAGLAEDGSDPRMLSLVLGATAVVSAMVLLLTVLNGRLLTVFGIAVAVLTVALAWAAVRTRVVPVEVEVSQGVVYVTKGESSYRFDLKKPDTRVEVSGRPGESGWSVRFERRHLEPFVIDASMVDPHTFLGQLREHRPEL
ncbi:hypothetical protein JK386_00675 [Nocardioides sp. zg-536]|uniref:Uncharacterized protein n=1 Tax=Nocardioides faecalis TaxID=2803858 RepID=A0A939BUE2_9ACTN|nr:hypothetical protein [Nocardioides faecalis]MBM9458412.1 hypothetical protein [Nocardioides faecalis]QVI58430.1 hypothetical protein KG111_15755 [Nocardioides faecalis]